MTNKEAAYILSDNCCDYSTEELRTAFSLAIKALERQSGEWIELKTNPEEFFGHRFYSCSNCGREIDVMAPEESLDNYPYCHCGACMVKEV